MAKNYFNTGTASFTAGNDTVTFSGVSVSLFKQGDEVIRSGLVGIIDSVDTGANTATLEKGWPGSTESGVAYTVKVNATGAELATSTRTLMQYISGPLLTIAALEGGSFPANGNFLVAQDGDWSTVASTGSDEVVRKTGATISAPTLSGHPTIEGVTSTGATGTGKLVFDTAPVLVAPTLGVAAATTLNVGGSGGSSQINAQAASAPSIGILKTGVVEYQMTVTSDNYLAFGYPSKPWYSYSDGGLTIGAKGSTFNSGVLFGVAHATAPKRGILKTSVVEFDETVNGDNYWELGNGTHSVVMNVGGGSFFGPGVDNDMSCGGASNRWTEIYAASGTINTSAGEAKYQPRALNDAELAVAKALAQNVRVYQFVDAVEKKGADLARLHIGHIFEDVVSAFEAQGLDPMRYGIVCENPATKVVTRSRTIQRQKMVPAEIAIESISVHDGKAVLSDDTQTHDVPAFEEYAVVDADGRAVLDERGVQRVHRVPIMEPFEEEYSETVPDMNDDGSAKTVKALRYGELTQFIIAGISAV